MVEHGLTVEYLAVKINIVANTLSYLYIDELNIPQILQDKSLTLLLESDHSNIKFPMYTAMIFKEQIQVPGLKDKGLSQTY
jgi:hypothetical protein